MYCGCRYTVKIGREHYPQMAEKFEALARYIVMKFELTYTPEIVSVIILAILLAAIRGVAFSFMHSDKKDD